MAEADSLATEYNKVVTTYGGSILHWIVTSGTPSVWGDVTSSTKFAGSSFFIGMIQEARKVLSYKEFGQVGDDNSICFAMSGVTLKVGDKISYKSINYEVSDIHTKTLEDKVIYYKMLLTNLGNN